MGAGAAGGASILMAGEMRGAPLRMADTARRARRWPVGAAAAP